MSEKDEMDSSFLAMPDEVMDWRRVLLVDLADRTGLLDRVPVSAADAATQLGLHEKSVRVVLEALTAWGVVVPDDGSFGPGPAMPDSDDRQLIRQHARFLQRWSEELPDRMEDPVNRDRAPRSAPALAEWLRGLGARARREAPAIIDTCLETFPEMSNVLDLAGGHAEYGIEASRRGLDVTMLDLPSVIDVVSDWPSVTNSGIHLEAGDVFDSTLTGPFDLVLCFGFTHTMPSDRVQELFGVLARLTTEGGGLAVKTFLRGRGPVPAIFAVQMLVGGNNGDSYALEQYEQWLTAAGFEAPEVVDCGQQSLLLSRRGSP